MPALPVPIESESFPVPRDDCFRFDDNQCGSPATPDLRQPGPEHPICGTQLHFVGALQALKNQKLMTQREDLRVERQVGSESFPNRIEQGENDREHGVRNLQRQLRKFN